MKKITEKNYISALCDYREEWDEDILDIDGDVEAEGEWTRIDKTHVKVEFSIPENDALPEATIEISAALEINENYFEYAIVSGSVKASVNDVVITDERELKCAKEFLDYCISDGWAPDYIYNPDED